MVMYRESHAEGARVDSREVWRGGGREVIGSSKSLVPYVHGEVCEWMGGDVEARRIKGLIHRLSSEGRYQQVRIGDLDED
jgi:ribosome modulation factor